MANFETWEEIEGQKFFWFLECVPPLKASSNAFLVGECYAYNSDGPMYRACVDIKGKFYSKIVPASKWNPAVYSQEVVNQFNLVKGV